MSILMAMAVLLATLELGPPRQLSTPEFVPANASRVRLVAGHDHFLILWQDFGSFQDRYVMVDAHGRPRTARGRTLGREISAAAADGRNYLLASNGSRAIQLIRVDGASGEATELPPVAVPSGMSVAALASDGQGYLLVLSANSVFWLVPLDLDGTPRSAPYLASIPVALIASAEGDGYLLTSTLSSTARVTSLGSIARTVNGARIAGEPRRLVFDGVQFVLFSRNQDRIVATAIDRDGRPSPGGTTVAIGFFGDAAPGVALIVRGQRMAVVPLGFGGVPLAAPRPLTWRPDAVATLPNGDAYLVSRSPFVGSVLSSPSLDGPEPTPVITAAIAQSDPRLVFLAEGQHVAFWSEGTTVYATRIRDGQPLDGRGLLVAANVSAWRVLAGDRGRALLAWQEANSGTASIFVRSVSMDAPPSSPLLIVSNAGAGDSIRLAAAAPAESGWAVLWSRGGRSWLTFLDDAAASAQPARELTANSRQRTAEPLELIKTPHGFLAVTRASERFLGGSGSVSIAVMPLDRAGVPVAEDVLLPNVLSACPTPDGGAAILSGQFPGSIAVVDGRGAVRGTTTVTATGVFRTSRSVILASDERLWLVSPDASLTELLVLPSSGRVTIAPGALVQANAVSNDELGVTTRLFLRSLSE